MSFKHKINKIRRRFMRILTSKIGRTTRIKSGTTLDPGAVKRVLIVRTNHRLGNLLLITPLLQEIIHTFPNAKVDIISQGFLSRVLFTAYNPVDQLITLPRKPFKELGSYLKNGWKVRRYKYDLAINAVSGSSSGKLYTQLSRATYKIYGEDNTTILAAQTDAVHIAKEQVYVFKDFVSRLGIQPKEGISDLSISLSQKEIQQGKERLLEMVDGKKPVIAIFTFATGDKCYKPEWWNPFYDLLLQEFPNHDIVEVLPYENVSQIGFRAPSYYSKDIREIAAFIKSTQVWVGADCGIMHLASASGAPVIGLFSRTNKHVYEPFNSRSCSLFTGDLQHDDIVKAIRSVVTD